MLYIQKGAAPTEVTRQVIEITKSDENRFLMNS